MTHVTGDALHRLQRDLYPPPKWHVATEVQVPYEDGLRFMDAVAVDLTAKHHELHGFEVKVGRADWLKELRHPNKSAPARAACDKWWLVAGPGVYRPDEVPESWGIIEVADTARVVREASRLRPHAAPPTPWPRNLFAAILARGHSAQHGTLQRAVREAEEKGYRKGMNAGRKRVGVARTGKVRYDPGRYNFDDGAPLALP